MCRRAIGRSSNLTEQGSQEHIVGIGAIGPSKATDWRMGLLWRNASSVAADALAIRVLDRRLRPISPCSAWYAQCGIQPCRSSEQFALHAALPGPQRGLGGKCSEQSADQYRR